jgi:adenylate kinase
MAQAEALDRWLASRGAAIRAVINLTVSEDSLVRRLSGRRTCRAAGHIYHVDFHPPAQPGVCDVDGSELYQREDDRPETVTRRIEVYLAQTAPLVQHYRREGLLVEIDGEPSAEEVTLSVRQRMERAVKE